MNQTTARRTGFTLVELIAVIVVLAVLAGVALPRYFDYQAQAREAATKGTLGGVRAGIANFYANQAINGSARYPTLAELQALGTVMQESIPENTYNSLNTIASATQAQSTTRATTGASGWFYYIDNTTTPPEFMFWANSDSDDGNVDEHNF